MKQGNKKVKVINGRTHLIRTLYKDGNGEYFKHGGEKCYVYKRDNGTLWCFGFNGVYVM